MMDYTEQLNRIKRKLEEVRRLDPKGKRSFGAGNFPHCHHYRLGKALPGKEIEKFETELKISLPQAYRAFLMNVGSGIDADHAGAGPYYGIYSLARIRDDIEAEETIDELGKECLVYPYMPQIRWNAICKLEEIWPFQGMLVFGTQGCAFDMMLVLNGDYRGRIVSVDKDCSGPPFFAFENNFLDWYERWLDEIIAGYSIDGFGYTVGGDEETLRRLFYESCDENLKETIVKSFAKFPGVTEESLQFLGNIICKQSIPSKCKAIQMMTKYDYVRAKPFLAVAIQGQEREKLAAFQAIVWYAKKHYNDWMKQIFVLLPEIREEETFRFASMILEENKDYLKTLQAIHNPLSFVRKKLIEQLGTTSKPKKLDLFYEGFEDSSDDIVLATVRSVRLITDDSFLPYFDHLIDKYVQRYEERSQNDPKDIDVALDGMLHESMREKHPEIAWLPRTIESTILWTIVGCLVMYGPNADYLLNKIAELPNNPVAGDAKMEMENRYRIREKQKNRKTFWAKLMRILLWK